MSLVYAKKVPPLPLKQAQHYALKIAEWIAPFCMQIEPVGELRRNCTTCTEVSLLTIPKMNEGKHLLFDFLDQYVQNSDEKARWENPSGALGLSGSKPASKTLNARIFLPKCTLHIHCATVDTWFLRLFETTGSNDHFLDMNHLVRSRNGHWRYAISIDLFHKRVVPRSEGEIYEIVSRPFLPPARRVR